MRNPFDRILQDRILCGNLQPGRDAGRLAAAVLVCNDYDHLRSLLLVMDTHDTGRFADYLETPYFSEGNAWNETFPALRRLAIDYIARHVRD